MNSEFVRSKVNISLVTKQVLSQVMSDSMRMESEGKITEVSGDLARKSLAYYSQELLCGECLERLLGSNEFMDILYTQQLSQIDKGRIEYLNINREPNEEYVLSRKL